MTLCERFVSLLEQHVYELTIRGRRAVGLCPFHSDRHPSFSADLEKCVWYCFPCGRGGGVRDFALALGERWEITHSEPRAAQTRRARFHAERQARAILARRVEERDKALCAEHREMYGEVLAATDLLGLFHRRPDLAGEFPDLVTQTEQEYGERLFRLLVLEARLNREVAF